MSDKICTKCGKGYHIKYINEWEAFGLHTYNIVGSVLRSSRQIFNDDYKSTTTRCDNSSCLAFGFICGNCGKVNTNDREYADGTLAICKYCNKSNYVRNPSHILGVD
jgi:hypothetical protein